MPFVLIESTYEGEHNASAVQIRRQAYWAILCGATGQFLGNRPIWLFDPGWQAALNSTGSLDMARLKMFFDGQPWYELIPDDKHEVVTEGLGEFTGLDYLTAARTKDGETVIAYMPTARPITVDMTKISGKEAKTVWFNPRTGQVRFRRAVSVDLQARIPPPGRWRLGAGSDGRRRQIALIRSRLLSASSKLS